MATMHHNSAGAPTSFLNAPVLLSNMRASEEGARGACQWLEDEARL